jgi:hypothetical protein
MSDMGKKGHNQGDMSPTVKDYQKPESVYPETGFSKTTQYIERNDKRQNEMSKDIKKQHYVGRYS